MSDARFEEGGFGALALMAASPEDLTVLASLTQDAVIDSKDLRYAPKARQFTLLLNRFRWEERRSPPERVRALLHLRDVKALASTGFSRGQATPLVLLDLVWAAGADGAGVLTLTCAGGAAIRAEVDCLNIDLRDVTRPYLAPSGQTPDHGA